MLIGDRRIEECELRLTTSIMQLSKAVEEFLTKLDVRITALELAETSKTSEENNAETR